MKNHSNFGIYDFSDYSEITGDALYQINGGAEAENISKQNSTLGWEQRAYAEAQKAAGKENKTWMPEENTCATNASETKETSNSAGSSSSTSYSKTSSEYHGVPPQYWESMDEQKEKNKASGESLDESSGETDNSGTEAINTQTNENIGNNSYVYGAPTDSRRVTSPKGIREDAEPQNHTGIDIGALVAGVKGDNIYSVENGIVVRNGITSESNCSRLEITLPNGDTAVYMHGDFLDFKTGDIIEKGQVLGSMSDIGSSGSVHLHFEIRTNGVYTSLASEAPDPLDFLPSDYYIER